MLDMLNDIMGSSNCEYEENRFSSFKPSNVDGTINKMFTIAKEENENKIRIFKMKSGNFQIISNEGEVFEVFDSIVEAKRYYILMCLNEV